MHAYVVPKNGRQAGQDLAAEGDLLRFNCTARGASSEAFPAAMSGKSFA